MFDSNQGADLSEFDLFLVNSEGVIQTLRERGAYNVKALHYAADPELNCPIGVAREMGRSILWLWQSNSREVDDEDDY